MNTQNQPYPDLYLTLSPGYDTLHLKRSDQADEGFAAFAQKSIRPFAEDAISPDYWLVHYRFSEEQIERLPALSGTRSRNFFNELLPSLLQEGITPRNILPMDRALGLLYKDKPLLTPVWEYPVAPLSCFLPASNALNLVRPAFHAYTALNTCRGVLLFTPSKRGGQLLEGYLQHMADNFYAPQMPEQVLDIRLLPAFDRTLRKYADLCPKAETFIPGQRASLNIPPEAFAPGAVLDGAAKCLRFDLTPSWQNFNALVMPPSHSGLHCSQQNYDIMCLQRIAQTGNLLPTQISHGTYRFSYAEQFSSFEKQLAHAAISPDGEIVSPEAGRYAAELLRRDFPSIRGAESRQAEQQQLQILDTFEQQPRQGHKI